MSFIEQGDELYESGKYEEAIKCYDKAIEIDPNDAHALNMKGISLNYLGKYKEEESCADEAIRNKCNEYENALALCIKAEALSYIGNSSNPIECADEAIRLSRKNKDIDCYALFVKGYALDYSNKHDDALKCFDRVIDYYDDEACDDEAVEASLIAKGIALNYKGMKHKDKDRYNEAEKCFDRAIEICKENSARYQDIAYAYIKSTSLYNLGRNNEVLDRCLIEALSYSNKSIEKNPNDAHAWMIKGIYFFKLGFYEMAIKCYDKIIMDINPEFDFAWCLKGYALNYLESYDEALKCFNEALKTNSQDADYYMGKGISLHNLEKYDDAINCFDKALMLESAYSDIVFFLKGASNYGNQQYVQVLEDFKNVDDIDLEDQKHINVGACYYSMRLEEEARNEYYAAIKSNPKLAEAYYNLGVLSINEGKSDIARKQFENCLEIDRKFTKAREALEKLDSPSSTSDWFKWWFSNGKAKKAFGITLILSIFALIIFAVAVNIYIFYPNQNVTSQPLRLNPSTLSSTITGITIMIGLLIVILLLPSIRRFKVGDIEIVPVPIDTKVQQHMEAIISKVKFGMQSY